MVAALEGRNEGPIPIIPPFQATWALNMMGVTPQETVNEPKKNAICQSKIADLCGFDGFEGMWDWLSMVEAMGCDVEFRPGMGAVTVSHVLSDDSDASIEVGPVDDKRAVTNLNTINALLDGDKFIYATVPGTFTLSAELRGLEQLMMDSILETDVYRDILRRTTENLKEYCIFYDEVAEGVMLCESTGSPSLLDPDSLRKEVVPLNAELFEVVDGYRMLHNCGDVTQLLPDLPTSSINLLSIHDTPLKESLESFDCCISGGISTFSSLLNDNPEKTLNDISQTIQTFKGNERRFILSASCDIPPSTPLGNVMVWQEHANSNNVLENIENCCRNN